ncbi:MAG TPA: type III-B CRISPR module RAMP protein Cmr4 [Armatimonadetes bacterium]|nr:type III-B CRISPR module RAMP protein Cmr4 [Armatimonadota bacterium]
METRPFLLHALSPLHVGTGQSADIIDLPIARQRATNIPYVPGSALKGVLRSAFEPGDEQYALFGPETTNADAHAGSIIVGDALLLALPVRSFKGTFVWATSPLLLQLARHDLPELKVPAFPDQKRAVVSDRRRILYEEKKLFLADLDLPATATTEVKDLGAKIDGWLGYGDWVQNRLAVVDDETMTFLLETCTQLDTRVRISNDTRTVARGALWIEESLPAETLLWGLMAADTVRKQETTLTPELALDRVFQVGQTLQVGGKATVGRGRCALWPAVEGRA